MRDVALVVPACYPDIFAAFVASLNAHAAAWPFARKILVRDEQRIELPEGWELIQGPSPYVMPVNVNLGLRASDPMDVVMASDDTQFTDVGSLEDLRRTTKYCALASPQIDGGCGIAEQKTDSGYVHDLMVDRIAFIFIYVKRDTIRHIGYWDECFTTYGHDDFDYCERIKRAGRSIIVTPSVVVKHGFHAPSMNTYGRKGTSDTAEGARIFAEKWGQ